MKRPSALFLVLGAIVGFILSLLCLISGHNTDFLPDVFVLKIDTSQIAQDIDIDDVLSAAGVDISAEDLQTGISSIDSAINGTSDQLGDIINTAAKALGLHDFYTAHLISWCEGSLTGSNATDNAANTTNTPQKVTKCTSAGFPFSFNPVEILETELLHNITLDQLGFPTSDVDGVVTTLETAYKAMSVCYLIGVIFAGTSCVAGLFGFKANKMLELLNHAIAFTSFVFLAVGSAIATAIGSAVMSVVEKEASVVNVHAYTSDKFMGMTWSATGIMCIVAVVWCACCCCGSHGGRKKSRWGQHGYGQQGYGYQPQPSPYRQPQTSPYGQQQAGYPHMSQPQQYGGRPNFGY